MSAFRLTRTVEGYEARIGRTVYRIRPDQTIAGDPTGQKFPWVLTTGSTGGEYEHGHPFAALADVRDHLAYLAAEETS